MSKVQSNWSLTEENFGPEQRTWIGVLLSALSSVLNQLLGAISGNLTIGDNVQGSTYTVNLTTAATYVASSTFNVIVLPWAPGPGRPPIALLIGKVTSPSSQAKNRAAVMIPDWTFEAGTSSIRVNFIAGLANSSTYALNLIAL